MIKYCIKVFDSDNKLKYQVIVPSLELEFHMELLSTYGIVKAFVLDDNEKSL